MSEDENVSKDEAKDNNINATNANDDLKSETEETEKTENPQKPTDDKAVEDDKADEDDEDDEDDSDDEEAPVGMLDRPIEILYTKREKRVVERFDPREQQKKTTPSKPTDISVPDGNGLPLSEHPKVVKNLAKESNSDLKVIFGVLFGHKRIKLADVKKALKQWRGWEVEANSEEHHKLEENAANLTTANLEWAMETLDIEVESGKKSKEVLMEALSQWCLKPEPRKKETKKETKKTPTKPAKKEAKKTKKSEKSDKQGDKPKRPLSAYFIWMSENRSAIVEELGTKDVKEVTKTAGEKWKSLTDDDKKEFEGRARILRGKYDAEMAKWNAAHPDEAKKAKTSKPTKPPKTKLSKVKLTTKRSAPESDAPKKKIKKKKITMPNEKDLIKAIKKILDGADLETITMKQVVQKVYDKYPGVDLMPKKAFIKSKVKEIIA